MKEAASRARSTHRDLANGPARVVNAPHWARGVRVVYLLAVDALALSICGAVAYLLWARPVHGQPVSMYLSLAPLLALFVGGYAVLGLYPGLGLGGVETLRRLTIVTTSCFAFVAATVFALKIPHQYSRMTFGLAFGASLVLVPAIRYWALLFARRWPWWAKPIVLVADPGEVEPAATALLRARNTGYRPVGILYPNGGTGDADVAGLPVIGSVGQAREITSRGIWTAVVVAETAPPVALVDELRQHFRHVLMLRSYADVGVERLQVRNLGGALCIEYANNLLLPQNRFIKRALDIVASSCLLILSSPLILLAILATRMTSRGPVFFFQIREGLHGREFRMPKIRTMYVDAERRLEAHLAADATARESWEEKFKLVDDPRVVPVVGTFLRRFSIDEAPQLVSVLLGDMSLVGPRPLPEYHLEALSESTRRIRAEVRPGISGLWQISGRADSSIDDQEARDEYYIRNWSLWLDLYILGRTAGAVLRGRGAY